MNDVLPQALRQSRRMAIENLLVGILSKNLAKKSLHFVLVLAEPVDAERCMIIMFVEPTCGMAGKT